MDPTAELPVRVRDLRGLDEAGWERARREHIAEERAVPFDLSRPPLLRVSALIESDEAWHLLEGGPLRLWCLPPPLDRLEAVDLSPVAPGRSPRDVVPAGWWQAAEPLG